MAWLNFVVLLPGCSNAVMIIGRLANNWNIPIFTYAGTSEVLANKTEFRTLTRLSFSLTLCAQFYVEVFKVSPYMKEVLHKEEQLLVLAF